MLEVKSDQPPHVNHSLKFITRSKDNTMEEKEFEVVDVGSYNDMELLAIVLDCLLELKERGLSDEQMQEIANAING